MSINFSKKISPNIDLIEIIKKSSLDDNSKNMWDNFIQELPNKEITSLLKAIKDDKENKLLNFLTDNLRKKYSAFKNNDENLWKKVLQEEKNYIKSIS